MESGRHLDPVGLGVRELVALVWGALRSPANTLHRPGGPSAKRPTPVCLKRKTNLYFVERAYCSQGALVANFSGSFG